MDRAAVNAASVLHEGVSIETVAERDVECLGVFQGLMYAGTDGVFVMLGLDSSCKSRG
jgi:hypothetical protein